MIRMFQGFESAAHGELFKQMYRQRKAVFHDALNWDVQIQDGEFEIDEFDREDTVYLMAFDESDALVGSTRLVSTATPHMLSGPFRSMFPSVGFCSPLIWEATRFLVLGDKSIQPNGVSTAACEILLGGCRFGLDNGLAQILAVYDSGVHRLYRRCGLHTTTLAKFRTELHGTVAVGISEMSKDLERSVLAMTGLEAPVRREAAVLAA